RPNGKHFGLGWDTVEHSPNGPVYTKNGGIQGYRSFIGHMQGNVDFSVLVTDASGDQGEATEMANVLMREIDRTETWPDVDLFDQFS
ncbi:MAG TPA: hypothetical protein VGY53_13290, partial [Isosphaeraceae bacterium]|nr:hypothetical protein [Isosphaeraceae bacterium]